MTFALSDSKVKLSLWYNNDITAKASSNIDSATSQCGLKQIIKEPTQKIGYSSSGIDLTLISHLNLGMEFRVHSSLHPNCHPFITFRKFNLKIQYPFAYELQV